MSETEYPLWGDDYVIDKIADNYYFKVELREHGNGVIWLLERRPHEAVRWTFREYVDPALMAPEHFRMVIEHFLRDGSSQGMHAIFTSDEVLNRVVALKEELELKHAVWNDLYLHCGSIETHSKHHHREGLKGYFCEGWSND